jgi:D-glycero-D-manno-heptose 1,7-bisphosphate phosphatase
MNANGQFAVFLDRDGVINRRRPEHVKALAEFEFLPGALDSLAELHRRGIRVIVVTNQSAVGRGLLREHELARIHEWMRLAVSVAGGHIERFYTCPHVPETQCSCRKPATQLFLKASSELGITLKGSVMIGDAWSDMQAAQAVGCVPILVSLREREARNDSVVVVRDLSEAVARLPEMQRQRQATRC